MKIFSCVLVFILLQISCTHKKQEICDPIVVAPELSNTFRIQRTHFSDYNLLYEYALWAKRNCRVSGDYTNPNYSFSIEESRNQQGLLYRKGNIYYLKKLGDTCYREYLNLNMNIGESKRISYISKLKAPSDTSKYAFSSSPQDIKLDTIMLDSVFHDSIYKFRLPHAVENNYCETGGSIALIIFVGKKFGIQGVYTTFNGYNPKSFEDSNIVFLNVSPRISALMEN